MAAPGNSSLDLSILKQEADSADGQAQSSMETSLALYRPRGEDCPDGDTQYIDPYTLPFPKFFRQLAVRLDAHWEPLATYLDIPNEKIATIKKGFTDPDEQICQMLILWQTNRALQKTEQILVLLANALWEAGRNDLAMEIRNRRWKKAAVDPAIPTTSSGRPHGYPSIEEKRMRAIGDKVSGEMEWLATELEVTSAQVDKIKDKYRKVLEQTFQMLLLWQQKTPGINHLAELVKALKAVGRNDVAMMIDETL